MVWQEHDAKGAAARPIRLGIRLEIRLGTSPRAERRAASKPGNPGAEPGRFHGLPDLPSCDRNDLAAAGASLNGRLIVPRDIIGSPR